MAPRFPGHFLSTFFAMMAAGALAACGSSEGDGERREGPTARAEGRQGQAVAVTTVTPDRISVQRQIELSGTLLSPDEAKVSSEAAGVVREVTVELGMEVRAGQPLLRLEAAELSLELERAESALRQVEAQLGMAAGATSAHGPERGEDDERPPVPPPPEEQMASVRQALANRDEARAAYARAEHLRGRGLLSQVDHDATQTRLKVADANYQAAIDTARSLKASLQDRRAAHALARKKLSDAIVRAPIPGSVSERLVQTGEYIRENTPVVTIVQMDPLKLRTGVQEKYAGAVKPGQAARFSVEAFPGRVFEGKVAFVSPAVDQALRTFTVEVVVDNSQRLLKPGFFAKGALDIRRDERVLAVSDAAVSTMAGVASVYVIDGNKARQQRVILGSHEGRVWEVVEGLEGTEKLAASNLNQLATGTAVRIDEKAAQEQPAAKEPPAAGPRGH
jgi:RND family efflux transporter MFP subunit